MKTTRPTKPMAGMSGVEQALNRAARRARSIAARTQTPLVVFQDGRIEHRSVALETAAANSEEFENFMAPVPDVPPPENDRLD